MVLSDLRLKLGQLVGKLDGAGGSGLYLGGRASLSLKSNLPVPKSRAGWILEAERSWANKGGRAHPPCCGAELMESQWQGSERAFPKPTGSLSPLTGTADVYGQAL